MKPKRSSLSATKHLKKEKELREELKELDRVAKLLVRRDFELMQANEALRELDMAKSQFVSVAAHQLRTPLSGIKWMFKMLSTGDFGSLTQEQQKVIERGAQMIDRLIELIADLLSVARIESGKVLYKFNAQNITDLLKRLVNESEVIAKEKGLILTLQKPNTEIPLVAVDEDRLLMALRNILENSIMYTPSGGKVSVSLNEKVNGVEIKISDTGIGIKEADLPRLFSKFFRGENVVKAQYPGTGLGLFIVKNVIDAHNGTINVESQEAKGTTFTITLPFKQE